MCIQKTSRWQQNSSEKNEEDKTKFRLLEVEELERVNDLFNERLLELVDNPNQKDKVLRLGRSSQFLRDSGMADAEIVLEFDKLARKSKEGYKHEHPFNMADIKDLPKAIASPRAVFDNTNGRNDGKVILTELKKNGRNFIVAVLAVRQSRKGGVVLEVNQIVTLFPKDAKGVVNWLNLGKATNIDKEKVLHFIEALPNHLGTTIKDEELVSAANVIRSFENPKVSDENVADDGIKLSLGDGGNREREQMDEAKMVERVKATGESLGGAEVHVYTSFVDVPEEYKKEVKKGARGWYDPSTHTVHVYLPYCRSGDEAQRTVIHESRLSFLFV